MYTLKHVNLSDSTIQSVTGDLDIHRLSLAQSEHYRQWFRLNNAALDRLAPKIAVSAYAFLKQQLALSKNVFLLSGKCDLFIYRWPNKELKVLPVWNNYHFNEHLLWLHRFPFLRSVDFPDVFHINCHYDSVVCDPHAQSVYLNTTHNDHFGHFLLDNYPSTILLSRILSVHRPFRNEPLPFLAHRASIDRAFEDVGLVSLSTSSSPPLYQSTPNPTLYTDVPLVDCVPGSSYSNAFLWKSIGYPHLALRASHTVCKRPPTPKKIAFIRSGNYTSRISNLSILLTWLDASGFYCVEPSQLSLSELVLLLQNAHTVISEPGSSTLNALLLSPDTCTVISLAPQRMLLDPSPEMLLGGLPYLFACPYKLRLLDCFSTVKHGIQSSDQIYVDLNRLALLLESDLVT